MEQWTVGHSGLFLTMLVSIYVIGVATRYIEKQKSINMGIFLYNSFLRIICIIIVLLWFAQEESSSLGISGAFAILAGGLFGLQLATMQGFPVVRRQEASEKPPEAERAAESEKK